MFGQRVQDHYARSGSGSAMAARIIAALRAHAGADVAITPETLAPVDHLHGRGELATQELTALLEPRPGEAILDIGSGLGGPARWIATKFGCAVTGVDLTAEHCDAAGELNAICGVSDRVRILEGSALALPVPDASFDRAYSHNVVMKHRRQGGRVSRGVPRVEAWRASRADARQCRPERAGRTLPGGLGVGARKQLPRDT